MMRGEATPLPVVMKLQMMAVSVLPLSRGARRWLCCSRRAWTVAAVWPEGRRWLASA